MLQKGLSEKVERIFIDLEELFPNMFYSLLEISTTRKILKNNKDM